MSVESDPHLSILVNCPQYHAKTMNIIGIGIRISVCVLVKPDEGIINPLIALESHPSDPELRQFRPAAASVGSFLPLQKGKSDAAAAHSPETWSGSCRSPCPYHSAMCRASIYHNYTQPVVRCEVSIISELASFVFAFPTSL